MRSCTLLFSYGTAANRRGMFFTLSLGGFLLSLMLPLYMVAQTPCQAPVQLFADQVSRYEARLNWTSAQTDINNHCWTIEVGVAGYSCGNSQQVQSYVFCLGDPGLMVNGQELSFDISGLQSGTAYQFSVVESCDGNAGNSGPCINGLSPVFQTLNEDFLVQIQAIPPDCGPANINGQLEIQILDASDCPGTIYDILVTDANMATVINQNALSAGQYSFPLPPGNYNITISEAGACSPVSGSQQFGQVIPAAIDMTAPNLQLLDFLSNVIADNDPDTGLDRLQSISGDLPDGDCGLQEVLFINYFDECEGPLANLNLLSLQVEATNGTQANLLAGPANLQVLEIYWGAGPSTVKLFGSDQVGNQDSLVLERNFTSGTAGQLSLIGANDLYIPSCLDSLTVPLTVQWEHPCDLAFDPNRYSIASTVPLTLLSQASQGQNYQLNYQLKIPNGQADFIVLATYEDPSGVLLIQQKNYSLNEDPNDQAYFLFETDPILTIPACENSLSYTKTIHLQTGCDPFSPDSLTIDPAEFSLSQSTAVGDNLYKLELTADLAAGDYDINLAYRGTQASFSQTVEAGSLSTDAPPINLETFLLPICEESADFSILLPLPEYCGQTPTVEMELDGQSLNNFSLLNDQIQLILALGIDDDGGLLSVSYTLESGDVITSEATISIVASLDDWAPIIVYPSQNLTASLAPCDEPNQDFQFYISSYDNCSPVADINLVVEADPEVILNDLGQGLFQASSPVGVFQVLITATDASGNSRQEDFQIIVEQGQIANTNLACQDTLNVVLNGACQFELTPEIVLLGEWGCLTNEDFDLVIQDIDPSNGPILDNAGVHAYTISSNSDEFDTCWGYLQAFDGNGPAIDCPEDVNSIEVDAQDVELVGFDLDSLLIDQLDPSIPHCYFLDQTGNIKIPTNPSQASALQALLDILNPTGYPGDGTTNIAVDNCSDVQICVQDNVQNSETCDNQVLIREFTATDVSGLSTVCSQTITIRRPTIGDLVSPPIIISLSCDLDLPTLENGYPSPEVTTYPAISTALGDIPVIENYQNIGVTFVDHSHIEICPESYRFLRRWTITDWCNPGASLNITQIIEVADETGPEIDCTIIESGYETSGDTLLISTGPFDCSAAFPLPLPMMTDNCGSSISLLSEVVDNMDPDATVFSSVLPDATDRYVSGIPTGFSYIRHTATDACGNSTVQYCPLWVEDQSVPEAICVDQLNFSLSENEASLLYATDLDEGSSDPCSEVSLEIRRQLNATCFGAIDAYSDWGEYVIFDCCDISQEVTVELRVTDASGNVNTCWANVFVEDKIHPTCIAPPNQEVVCNDLPIGFDAYDTADLQDLFGEATGEDNCDIGLVIEQLPLVDLNDCGVGRIVRRFVVMDTYANISGNICQQTIDINEVHDYAIRFPADRAIECGQPSGDTIQVYENGCDLLSISVDDERIAAADACFKIKRTYRVINWCEYDGTSPPIEIGRDEDCDGNPGDEAVWLIRQPEHSYVDQDSLPFNNLPVANAGAPCQEPHPAGYWRELDEASNGFWEYCQFLKVSDNTPPVLLVSHFDPFCSINNETCLAPVDLIFFAFEECSSEEIDIEVFYDEYADGTIDANVLDENPLAGLYPKFNFEWQAPIGVHEWILIATDACGNVAQLDVPFEVVDCAIASPICINGLTVTLEELEAGTDIDGDGSTDKGGASIWATDFIASDNPDCSDPLTYSINLVGDMPDINQQSLIFTCEHIPGQEIEIYSWDNAFNPYSVQPDGTVGGPNYDFCVTYILVQDDNANNLCPGPTAMISGHIQNLNGDPLDAVQVHFEGPDTNMTLTQFGLYEMFPLEVGFDYLVRPSSAADPLLGVTTLDLLLIGKHIQGTQLLETPEAYIAADINGSGSISTLDIIKLRKVLLLIDDNLPNDISWRFLPADYQFAADQNPLITGFPESILVPELEFDVFSQDFRAIKIGDVSGANQQNLSNNSVVSPHSYTEPYKIRIEKITKDLSHKIEWQFFVPDGELPEAMDWELILPAEIVNWSYHEGAVDERHFSLEENQLRLSYLAFLDGPLDPEKPVLVLQGEQSNSNFITENEPENTQFAGEAIFYNQSRRIVFSNQLIDLEEFVQVINCQPNPLIDQARLTFYLPSNQLAYFEIYGSDGVLLRNGRINGGKGDNLLFLERAYFPAPGVYFVRIKQGNQQDLQSIIVQ